MKKLDLAEIAYVVKASFKDTVSLSFCLSQTHRKEKEGNLHDPQVIFSNDCNRRGDTFARM